MLDDIIWNNAGHDDWCSVSITPSQMHFRVNKTATRTFNSFIEASDYNTNCLINDYTTKPFYVGLSGGIDSEIVAESFLKNKINFTPLILKLANTNNIEVWFAEYWCYKNKLTPLIVELSTSDVENKFIPLMKKIKYSHQAPVIFLWLCEYINSLDGYLVAGWSDINWDKESNTFYNNVVDWGNELYLHYDQPAGWFSYTPDLAAYYIKQFDITLDEQYNKLNFFNVSPRPKISYFNKIWYLSDKLYKAWYLWEQTKPNANRYEFGNKEETLFKLTGKND